MSKYESREDLYWKIDWEGADYFFSGYGIDANDAPDQEVADLIIEVNDARAEYEEALEKLMTLLGESVEQ